MSNDTAARSPQTTEQAQAWLATYTGKHRELAALMDAIVSDYYCASCLDDEAARAYDLLVDYASGRTEGIDSRFDERMRGEVETAIALMRELGGAWGVDGCLYRTAYSVADAVGPNPFEVDLADLEVNQWFTLDELAAMTGRRLPPA